MIKMISTDTIIKFNTLYKEVIYYHNIANAILLSSIYSKKLGQRIIVLGPDYVKLKLLPKDYDKSFRALRSESLFRIDMKTCIKKIAENGYYNNIIPFFITHMSIKCDHLEFLTKQTFIDMNNILLKIREEPPF